MIISDALEKQVFCHVVVDWWFQLSGLFAMTYMANDVAHMQNKKCRLCTRINISWTSNFRSIEQLLLVGINSRKPENLVVFPPLWIMTWWWITTCLMTSYNPTFFTDANNKNRGCTKGWTLPWIVISNYYNSVYYLKLIRQYGKIAPPWIMINYYVFCDVITRHFIRELHQ